MSNEPKPGADLPVLARHFADDHKVNLAKYEGAPRQRIDDIVAAYPVIDGETVVRFGVEPQRGINRHLDELLRGIRTSEAGVAGELTLELARNIKAMNLPRLQREAAGQDWVMASVGRLPVVGKWASALRYFQLSNRDIVKHLADIESRAQREMAKLNGINTKLDKLAEKTIDALKELELHLAAGQAILMRARARFEGNKQAVAQSGDLIALTRLRDQAAQLQQAQAAALGVAVSGALLDYLQALVEATRSGRWFTQGLSPRAAIAVLRAARARAFMAGRDYVAPDDLQAILPQTVAHRLVPASGAGRGAREQVQALVEATPVP